MTNPKSHPIPFAQTGFAPDRFAYDMIQWAFLPWTMLEEANRRLATGWTAEPQR